MVLSRQDAEALGIQLDPVEPQQEEEETVQPDDNQLEELQESQQQLEELQEPQQLEQLPEQQPEPELSEFQPETQEMPNEPEPDSKIEEKESITVVPETAKEVEKEEDTRTVSLDAVGDGESSANDVLSNIIQSLFNPNEPNQSNVSIVPRMVGGKRKLCLRLPASTASALLAQTGSPLATSFASEGGIPKKIKIVIPPNSMSSSAGIVQGLANSTVTTNESTIIRKSNQTTGPARLDPDTLPNSPAKSSSKPFLASLFSNNNPSTSSSNTIPPVKKPLGSTENPIQLVQEGNSFRSLQPLTPDQLKHIASVLKQNRQAILSADGTKTADAEKRRVVYDAASNTRIVYRVVTPGELKKPVVTTPVVIKPTTPIQRGRGRGRGRPPRSFNQSRKQSPEDSDSEDLADEEMALDMSKVINFNYLILI